MEKYKYGPLLYVTQGMDDEEGNYYWAGSPPVGYDSSGIPIDKNGNQCLDISCPLHPGWEPEDTVYSIVLLDDIPTVDSYLQWFEANFLIVSKKQIKSWIIQRWARKNRGTTMYNEILNTYSSVEEIMEEVWPDEMTS